jgi:hypothetical protein
MKKYILAIVAGVIAVCSNNNAHALVVTLDGSKTWSGYMNVSQINPNGTAGAGEFGSPWTLSDVKTTISGNTVTLQPNFNCYNAADTFWANGAIGNKFMEASSFLEYAAGSLLGNTSLTFTGNIDSYTLASGYNAVAFIKAINQYNGYSMDLFRSASLASGSSFSITADISGVTGLILQTGFTVTGRNANPLQEADLGRAVVSSAVVSAIPEPSVASLLGFGVLGLVATRLRRRS